jgi:hypothetical protein
MNGGYFSSDIGTGTTDFNSSIDIFKSSLSLGVFKMPSSTIASIL